MSKVIDSIGAVIAKGTNKYCNNILRLAYCHPADVTEEDEIIYHDFLYGEGWSGTLHIEYDYSESDKLLIEVLEGSIKTTTSLSTKIHLEMQLEQLKAKYVNI